MSGLRPCEQEWSAEKAKGVRELVERLTGGPCPCDQGKACPVLPRVRDTRTSLPVPKARTLMSVPGVLLALEVAQHVFASLAA